MNMALKRCTACHREIYPYREDRFVCVPKCPGPPLPGPDYAADEVKERRQKGYIDVPYDHPDESFTTICIEGGHVSLSVESSSGHDGGSIGLRKVLAAVAADPELRPLLEEALNFGRVPKRSNYPV